MNWKAIEQKLKTAPGSVGFYYKNLVDGEERDFRGDEKFYAASVIKTYIMAAAFAKIERGELEQDKIIAMKKEYCVPSCGAVAYMHEGLEVTVMDLITLMIIFSDNTTTNMLIDLMGMEEINAEVKALGYEDPWLRRKMYDWEKARRGIQNLITPRGVGRILTDIYEGRVVSRAASEKMLSILKDQQYDSKMPFYLRALDDAPVVAHKTGEDTGITHDVGIVYAEKPFVVCFCGNETDTPMFERVMAEITYYLYLENSPELLTKGNVRWEEIYRQFAERRDEYEDHKN